MSTLRERRVTIPEDALTPPQLAELIGCDPATVRSWIHDDDDPLPAVRIKKRRRTYYYVSEAKAAAWLRRQGVL